MPAKSRREMIEEMIAESPDDAELRYMLAMEHVSAGDDAGAVRCFEEMIRRAPDYHIGYASLGGLLLSLGAYDRAIDTLRLAVNLRPDAVAFSNLGTAYFYAGRLTQAVDAYNQAFQFSDADYRLWLNLGDAYYWLRNRPDQARDAYRQGLRLGREQMASRAQGGHSADPMIPAQLAAMFPKLGEPDSARVMLGQALALDSLNSRVQYQAALTCWQLGAREQAIDWLKRAVAGGYPVVWLRDSPVHRDWQSAPGFTTLLASAQAGVERSPGRGGTR